MGLIWGWKGAIWALRHCRISPIGDFSHLWDEVLHHGNGFFGLGFGTKSHFGSHVAEAQTFDNVLINKMESTL